MRLSMSLIAALALLPATQAQDTASCSTQTTRGTYAFTCSGWMSPAANAPQVPFSALGSATADYSGMFTGAAKASIGGATIDWTVTTSSNTLNPDCTGTIVYDQKINGQSVPPITINYHVLDDGKQIRGMSLNPGSTILCDLRRVRK